MKTLLWYLLQALWGAPQNLIGLAIAELFRKHKQFRFHGAIVTGWKFRCCMSMGVFLFMDERFLHDKALLTHEYGHSVQSLILGWLYLPAVAIPSAVWFHFPACRHYRERTGRSYYSFYTERWANTLGERVTGVSCAGLRF